MPGVQSKHVFPGLVAGDEDLKLRIASPANVSIRIRAEAEGVELSSCIAILGPVDPGGALATTASSSRELTDLSRWPLAAMLSASGNIGALFLISGSEPAAHEWSRVRPGCYQVGIEAWDREKRLLYPIASGPLEFGPGHHELVAHLRPGGSISDRVVGGAPSEALTVALIDERGALLPIFLDGGKAIDVLPVDAKGEFHVELAPTGELTLIVGSEAELRSGRPRVRQPLTIRPGENAPLSVELE